MRSSKNPDEFFDKMKKKPALQKILDTFDEYDIESIEKLDQPRWIRLHLLRLKEGTTVQQKTSLAEQEAERMEAATVDDGSSNVLYETRIWNNGIWVPKVTDGFSIDTNDGDILLVHSSNIVQNDSTIMNLTVQSMVEFMNGSILFDRMTKTDYKIALRQRMNDKYKGEHIVDMNRSTLSGALGTYGVKFGK